MPDFYKDHGGLSPDAYPDSEYLDWAQDKGLYVDAAGNVDYGPPARDADRTVAIGDEDMLTARSETGTGLDTWDF